MSAFYDLASLAKPLVTAPLAHAFLDLDADRRFVLGFHDRRDPLTARELLSHSAGLPPWRPFTGEPLALQLQRSTPDHPLLRKVSPGAATYSDLGYRLLAELLESATGIPFMTLGGALSGLSPAPWMNAPTELPDGPDAEAWSLAEPGKAVPFREAVLPHDLNARVGMRGHAGFGATKASLRAWLRIWSAQWAPRMCVESSTEADGSIWGLGLRAAHLGPGRFAELLARVPKNAGLHVQEDAMHDMPGPAPMLNPKPGASSGWWCHFGFTGPALFYRPEDGACIGLLLHRRGSAGGLLDAEALRARRWKLLSSITGKLGA